MGGHKQSGLLETVALIVWVQSVWGEWSGLGGSCSAVSQISSTTLGLGRPSSPPPHITTGTVTSSLLSPSHFRRNNVLWVVLFFKLTLAVLFFCPLLYLILFSLSPIFSLKPHLLATVLLWDLTQARWQGLWSCWSRGKSEAGWCPCSCLFGWHACKVSITVSAEVSGGGGGGEQRSDRWHSAAETCPSVVSN